MVVKPAIVALSLVAAGCASYIEQGKDFADQGAKVTLQAPCAMTLGSFKRLSKEKYDAVDKYADVICP